MLSREFDGLVVAGPGVEGELCIMELNMLVFRTRKKVSKVGDNLT